ncbi:MAG: response regulator transcription factor [Actinomycetota bacterium]|nr:response regulator transcription factor [Actinomycetota bacterium]
MRVVLADDAVVLREGLARVLEGAGVRVVGQAGTADELLVLVAAQLPDVALVDIRMPPTFTHEGIEAARRIRARHPRTAVLLLSQHVELPYALRLLETGERGTGYLLKDRVLHAGELVAALRRLRDGGTVVEPALVDELVAAPGVRSDPLEPLTSRERQVLALMARGLTDRGIADRLVLSPKTVEAHVRSILRKLDLPTDASENRRVHAVLRFLASAGVATTIPARGPDSSDG